MEYPAQAVDLVPCPHKGYEEEYHNRWWLLNGLMQAAARAREVQLIWGGNWKREPSHLLRPDRFVDLPHFELVLT